MKKVQALTKDACLTVVLDANALLCMQSSEAPL
jgi:hypothetical protein